MAAGEREAARAVVLMLHGFSMQPEDLAPFAASMSVPAWFLFPEGPVAAEPRGRAWFAIDARARAASLARGPRDFATQHPPDLAEARSQVAALLDAAAALAAGRPLIAVGFSQGGMVLCDTLVRAPRPISALALLSSSRIAFDEWQPLLSAGAARGLRVLVTHGLVDDDLAFTAGESLRDSLVAAGAAVDFHAFPEGHEIPLTVWRRLRKLIQSVI